MGGALDGATDLFDREWLGQVVIGIFHCGDGIFDRAVSGHQDHDRFLGGFLDFFQELQAVHFGHTPIAEDEVDFRQASDDWSACGPLSALWTS